MILIYIDDVVLGDTDVDEISNIKTLLNYKFSIEDLGVLRYFLGFEVARSKKGITLCQRKSTLNILQGIHLIGVKSCNTPMQSHLQLHKNSNQLLSNSTAC